MNSALRPRSAIAAATILTLTLLAASIPTGLAADSSATTTNDAPVVAAVYFYASDPTSGSGATCAAASRLTSFNPSAGSDRTIYACVEASDGNGYNDICDSGGASASDVRTFNATNSAGTSISDANTPKDNVALTCATGSGSAVALIGSFGMEYYHPWGLAAAANAYRFVPRIVDVAGAQADPYVGNFDYTNLTSLDASAVATISLGGALAPGDTGVDATASIYNKGNTAFNVYVSGSDLTGSTRAQTVATGNLKWATSASVEYGSKTALTTSSSSTGLSAPAETVDGTTARDVYFQLGVPAGSSQWIPADTYAGTVTFATG